MDFLGGATPLDSFLKAYKAIGTKKMFPYEWFDNPVNLIFPNRHRMKPFPVNLKTKILQIKIFVIFRSWERVDLTSNKH